MQYLLGIDLGSSSVKVSLLDADSGECKASAHYPESEAPIKALQPGWAEQRPDDWWHYFKMALQKAMSAVGGLPSDILAIGISYQMHGLVCLDKDLQPLRDAIIWCDSRGVPYGEHAPLPGNFTAAKLAWVKEHEPELFERIKYIMLPGDYLALRLTGIPATTACGLSEMMLWNFGNTPQPPSRGDEKGCSPHSRNHPPLRGAGGCSAQGSLSHGMLDYFGFSKDIIPPLVPTFGEQGRLTKEAAKELSLKVGTPVTYRAGDQPNNALSLRVLHPGEVAATAGTSGVVYGIASPPAPLRMERGVDTPYISLPSPHGEGLGVRPINTFLHVNHTLGLMHCINGCGILNSWMRRTLWPTVSPLAPTQCQTVPPSAPTQWPMVSPSAPTQCQTVPPSAPTYEEMNTLAATAAVGSEGVSIIPFGNGAERVLGNKDIGASIHGLNFNRHTRAHLLRAAQEGVAFAFMYGMELMGDINVIHAGRANMFLSPIFRDTLSTISGATIHLYDTDGSVGAARGAGLGCGLYANEDEAFASLRQLATIEPRKDYEAPLKETYQRWKEILNQTLGQ